MKRNKNNSLFDPVLLRRSLRASFTKLDPRQMIKNPIMFTVEAVTFAMLLLFGRSDFGSRGAKKEIARDKAAQRRNANNCKTHSAGTPAYGWRRGSLPGRGAGL